MASTLLQLLAYTPEQAIIKMLNDVNGTSFHLDSFDISAPVALSNTTTQVTLTPILIPEIQDESLPDGPITFVYERLPLASYMAGRMNNYRPTLPMSTQGVLDEITEQLHQTFYLDDIVLEEVTRDNGSPYALKAKSYSLRFVGSAELPLIDLIPISDMIDTGLIALLDDESQVLLPVDASAGYLNGTDMQPQLGQVPVGTVIQNSYDFLVTAVNAIVPEVSSGKHHLYTWVASQTPGPYNLYNAKVISKGNAIPASGAVDANGNPIPFINPAVPTLDAVMVIEVDPAYCTNFKGTLSIPYSTLDFNTDGFTNVPRLVTESVVSVSDGSEWNAYLNTLKVGDDLSNFQSSPPVTMDGAEAWGSFPSLFRKTNLYGATVAYNGPLRATDMLPATVGLDRVLVVNMGPYNSVYSGLYAFYYQAVIQMSTTYIASTVGSAVHTDFTPTKGTGPYTYAIVGGTLPPGLSLNGSILSGTPTTADTYQYTLAITDALGNTVDFAIVHQVAATIKLLTLTGTLPDATENESWEGFLDISGGLAPYTLNPVTGDLPSTVTASIEYNTVLISGVWKDNSPHLFSINVSSSDGQNVIRNYQVQAAGKVLDMEPSATWSENIYIGHDFNGSFTVKGLGSPYTFSVASDSPDQLPDGWLLNTGTGSVQGQATSSGSYTVIIQAVGTEGSVGRCTLTFKVREATLPDMIMADAPIAYWRCNDTGSTMKQSAGGEALDGTFTNGDNIQGPVLYPGGDVSMSSVGVGSGGQVPNIGVYLNGPFTLECVFQMVTAPTTTWAGIFVNIMEITGLDGLGICLMGDAHDIPAAFGSQLGDGPIATASVGTDVHHMVMTVDVDGYIRLYVDGDLVGRSSKSFPLPLSFGYNWMMLGDTVDGHPVEGYGCDFAIYDTALSAARIAAHYDAMTGD